MASTPAKSRTRKTKSKRESVANLRTRSRVVKGIGAVRPDRPSVKRTISVDGLTDWAFLSRRANERKKSVPSAPVARWSTRNVLATVIIVAAVVTAYIGHVHATQALATDVHEALMEQEILRLRYDDAKGRFDYATQPSVIYERAGALGLTDPARYGETLYLLR